MLRHSARAFVPTVDFMTSSGFGRDGAGREGHRGAGPSVVITDLGVLRPDPASHELQLVAVHPEIEVGEVEESTGWSLQVSADLDVTEAPTDEELEVLRDLKNRTSRAHSGG